MSADDTTDDGEGTEQSDAEEFDGDGGNVRERLEEEADRAVEQFDEGIVDMLSWVLETETRARIYVFLRQNPDSTSDEIVDGTGLYPSTVREALAELHDEEKVTRQKRESDGAGNNPYEYAAMAPSELVGSIVDDVQAELNTVFNLDEVIGADEDGESLDGEEPVTITVEDADADDGDESADGTEATADDNEETAGGTEDDGGSDDAEGE